MIRPHVRMSRVRRSFPSPRLGHALGLLLAAGCSTAAPHARAPDVAYLRASPIVEYVPPSVEPTDSGRVASDTPSDTGGGDGEGSEPGVSIGEDAEFGQEPAGSRASAPTTAQAPRSTPAAVIAEANSAASQAPEAEGFLNAVMTYTFLPGAIFKVFAAPNNVTDLVLEPGEELMGDPAAGDTLRWRLGVGTSASAGVPQKHIFIKPTRAGLATNLTLNTNRRAYYLKLESVEGEFMVAVQWSYPQAQTSTALAEAPTATSGEPAATATPADVTALNFDYSIEVTDGHPVWKPQAVYDDGRKTFIRFDPSILHGESPALFVIERGEMQLVNYRVKGNLYIVDRLFAVAELRLGQDNQDCVRILNRRRAAPRRPAAPSSPRFGSPK